MDAALARLLSRAGLSRYQAWEWFEGCALEKTVILAPDAALADSLTRCWLPQIRAVLPGCEVRVGQKAAPKQAPKTAWRGQAEAAKTGDLW